MAAAKHLIPMTLELGRKSLIIVDSIVDVSLPANESFFGGDKPTLDRSVLHQIIFLPNLPSFIPSLQCSTSIMILSSQKVL